MRLRQNEITGALRAAGSGGTVAQLDGFATSIPPEDGPLQAEAARPSGKRDPYAMDQMGLKAWDRFQTLGGIQFYFDTEFQLLRGHMYYSGTEWALSSINQHGLWERRPTLDRDGHISVLSVDIGDFNAASNHLVDEFGRGKAARDCTADEIAAEVWRQIVDALTSNVDNAPEELLPWPVWYALDRGLVMACGPGQGEGRVGSKRDPIPGSHRRGLAESARRPPLESPRHVVDLDTTGGLLAGRSRAARCLAGSSRRLPGAQQLGGVRRHMDQDVHADDIDGGCV